MNMYIQKFIDRKEETNFLEKEYKKTKPFFIVLYGRRRVGKTELIQQFLKNKKSIYFLATQEVEKENIISFSEELASFFNDSSLKLNPFFSFKQVMEYLKEKTKKMESKAVLVIDEFPYLVESNKAIPSLLQKYWDLYFKNSPLGIILCGSSISAMESGVLGKKSPLYGRRTGQWKLEPLFFKEAREFFPLLKPEEQIGFYSAVGGIPLYLLELNPRLDLWENIKSNIARKGAFLYEEVYFILKEELREPRFYFSLLKEIASGRTRLKYLSDALGVERTLLGRYIETLENLDLIEKQVPPTAKPNSKNTRYFLKDNFFRFWFRFVFPHKKELERKEVKKFLNNLKKNLSSFVGYSFEQICQEFLLKQDLFSFTKLGRQWGKIPNAPKDKNQYEIDFCGINEKEKTILFGECKWQSQVNVYSVLNELKEKAAYVDWHNKERKEYYAIFVKSFRKKIKEKNLYLFDLEDMRKF